MAVVLGGLIGTHSDLDCIDFFYANIVLLVKFARILVILDEIFEVADVLFLFPSASFYIPIQPLDQVIIFAVLLLHVKYLFHLIVLLLVALFLALLQFEWPVAPHCLNK